MNSLNWQTGHHVELGLEWLPKMPTPSIEEKINTKRDKRDNVEEDDDDEQNEPTDENKIKGKSTMSRAKQKAYDRMLATLQREEEALRREQERLKNAAEDEIKNRREAERQRQLKIIEDRERAVRDRAQRKLEREGAALKKRRDAEALEKAFKEEHPKK